MGTSNVQVRPTGLDERPDEISQQEGAATLVSKVDDPSNWMSPQDVAEAVALFSPGLVGEIWSLVQREMAEEMARHVRLEDKAKNLLTAAGASLSLALGFGGKTLFDSRDHLRHHWVFAIAIIVILGYGIYYGLRASKRAAEALKTTRTYASLNQRSILDTAELEAADHAKDERDESEEPKSEAEGSKNDLDPYRVARYRRFLLPQAWEVVAMRYKANEAKATTVSNGQDDFLVFLKSIIVVALLTAIHVIWRVLS